MKYLERWFLEFSIRKDADPYLPEVDDAKKKLVGLTMDNVMIESFIGSFRDECLNGPVFWVDLRPAKL